MTGASSNQQLLVETDWLGARLDDANVRIVDIRGIIRPASAPKPHYVACHAEYAKGHIPGAVFVDWLVDIVQPDAPVPMTVASPERFAALMGRLGIGDRHTVVVYDDDGGHTASRLWWVLNFYGHHAVSLVNGGYSKWVAEGRPVTAEAPKHPAAAFTPRPQPGWRAMMDEVRRALQDPGAVLVDCRAPALFKGEETRGQRAGRLPGAVNVPITDLVEGPHKTFRTPEAIRRLFAAVGAAGHKRVITYCNAGVSASVGLFALHLAGHPNATNYAGSWYEWERDPANPAETG
ncbi:MAG TPA: sulfurtransferase [Candidatus Methylomirabilis sp.]|jgi:thiosulfate/3-mercaptopyruvate sulfurtransferase